MTTESVFLLHRRPKTQLKGRPNAQNPLSQKKSGQGGRVPLFRKKSCRTTQKHNAHTDLGGDFLFFFCCHLFKKVHKHNTNAKAQIKKMINVVTHCLTVSWGHTTFSSSIYIIHISPPSNETIDPLLLLAFRALNIQCARDDSKTGSFSCNA